MKRNYFFIAQYICIYTSPWTTEKRSVRANVLGARPLEPCRPWAVCSFRGVTFVNMWRMCKGHVLWSPWLEVISNCLSFITLPLKQLSIMYILLKHVSKRWFAIIYCVNSRKNPVGKIWRKINSIWYVFGVSIEKPWREKSRDRHMLVLTLPH
jgi:hypothetical protein